MGSGDSPELGLQGRQPDGNKNRKWAATRFQRKQTLDSRSEGSTCAQQASGSQPCLAHLSPQTTSPSAPHHRCPRARPEEKGRCPSPACPSPISMESETTSPGMTHVVPTASPVFCSSLTSDPTPKGREALPPTHGPAPSAPNTNSQGKALAGSIQMSVYFLNCGSGLLSLHALGPVADPHIQEKCPVSPSAQIQGLSKSWGPCGH